MRTDIRAILADRVPSSVDVRAVGGVGTAIAILVWGGLSPAGSISSSMQSSLAIFGFTLVLWLTEALPYVVSSSASVVLLFVSNAVDSFQAATTGFSSSLVFFLLFLFLLGQAISKTDLDMWFASRLLSNDRRTRRPVRAIAIQMFLLAFFMPSATARALTFVPIVRRVIEYKGRAVESSLGTSLFLVVSHVNPIASMAFMTGGGMAIVTASLLEKSVQTISWTRWAVLMLPPVVLLYSLSSLTLAFLCDDAAPDDRREVRAEGGSEARAEDDIPSDRPGDVAPRSLTTEQRIVGCVLAGTVCLWIAGSVVGLPAIAPAALAVFLLAAPPVGILTSDDVQHVNWGVLFLLATMLSLLDALESTGALSYLTRTAATALPFASLTHWQIVGLLLALTAVVRLFFSTGSAALMVALPVVFEFGGRFGVNGLYLGLGSLLVVGSTSLLPFNATTTLIAVDRGPLSTGTVLSFGLVTMTYSLLVTALSWVLYWPLVT